jgi:hypothetical protein
MFNWRLGILPVAFAVVLSGCGGGGSSATPTSPNGGNTSSLVTQDPDLFNLDGSSLLTTLEEDQGIVVTSARTAPQNAVATAPVRRATGSFVFQATGGTATVARNNGASSYGVGFLSTYRDASGLCECSNDNPSLPKPYPATLSNPSWPASPFGTYGSTTTLSIGFKSTVDSSNHGGTYTDALNGAPGGSATFTIPNAAVSLPRLAPPTITSDSSNVYASWPAAAGVNEYFLAFMTHKGNVSTNPIVVVGFIVTDKTSVTIPLNLFYSATKYEAVLIGSDRQYINVYLSQGIQQMPTLPSQIDFTISQLALFTTP